MNTSIPAKGVIRSWLVAHLAEIASINPEEVDVRMPFESYGLSSRDSVTLSGDLEDWLGWSIEPTIAWKYPTIEVLAEHLAAGPAASEHEAVVQEEHIDPNGRPLGEPIAIIGIGCRFPKANGPQAFWHLLRNGVDAITEIPPDRWDIEEYYDPQPAAPGKMVTRRAGFLDHVDLFDHTFFGISPREAARIDPQQRLLLEVAWEAIEDAGVTREMLHHSMTGVFIGVSSIDYAQYQFADAGSIDAYAGTGSALSIAANRLSYFLDLRGPSLAIDTACSSSLVAVYMACQSLRSGDCQLALAGGVNLILTPAISITFTKAGVLSPVGRSKAFDAGADGYVRGEGAGIVVLKPLSQAIADRDAIYAVIRGGAVNHDGRSNGLMAPNPQAQEAVIREAYRRSGVLPGDVGYVEAHGTGTYLGDPIEARALGTVLAGGRPAGMPCAIGSVKTNIGHLEAAAGVAGLIKVALALKYKQLPPSLHFHQPNPQIPFDDLMLYVQATLSPWPGRIGPKVAGISSFGFGGTNAHLVLEEAPRAAGAGEHPGFIPPPAFPLTISAHSLQALKAAAAALRDWFHPQGPAVSFDLKDIAYTACVRRSHHDCRLALVARDHAGVFAGLSSLVNGELRSGIFTGNAVPGRENRLVFVFSGQGSQWAGMGRLLLEQSPVFLESMQRCDQAVRRAAGWSVIEALTQENAGSDLDQIDIAQPLLFAVQVSLAALWRSWGIKPDAVLGHSCGEIAAAHAAGVISLDDAARIICTRSALMQQKSGSGAMLAVGMSPAEARELIVDCKDRVVVAVCNSPSAVVLSGETDAIEAIEKTLARQGVLHKRVKAGVAAHSPQMDSLRPILVQELEGVQHYKALAPFYSSVTGSLAGDAAIGAEYWGRNLREPVQFDRAIQCLAESGHNIFIEISPHPILLSAIQQGVQHAGGSCLGVPSLRRAEPEWETMLGSLCSLYTYGYPLEWNRFFPPGGNRVQLPMYPWQRQRHWFEAGEVSWKRLKSQEWKADQHGQKPPEEHQDWLYQPAWQPSDLSDRELPPLSARDRFLILADSTGTGEALASLIALQGGRCLLVERGEAYRRLSSDRYRVRAGHQADLRLLFDSVAEAQDDSRLTIVNLWSIAGPGSGSLDSASLSEAQLSGCGLAASLVQILDRTAERASRIRIWLVTRGSQAISGVIQSAGLSQAPLWGFGRTLALEHPELWGGLVDLDPHHSAAQSASLLARELLASDGEDQVGFRMDRRYALRLKSKVEHRLPAKPLVWKDDAGYLLTGGSGDLGLEVARWMVRQGARCIALLSRTGLPPRESWDEVEPGTRLARQIAAVRELEAAGASILAASVDVTDEAALRSFLKDYRQAGRPDIKGIMHLAGVAKIESILEADNEALLSVLAPKMIGAWALHQAFENDGLDFFVMFSSAAALLSSPLLAGYAAGNAFLDALAYFRRLRGEPALSINWGYWSGVGMAARHQTETGRKLLPPGMQSFTPAQGLEILDRLMREDEVQACVLPVDWQIWSRAHPQASRQPFLSGLAGEAVPDVPHQQAPPQGGRGKDAGQLRENIQLYLQQQVARVLCMEPGAIPFDRSLMDLGLDSMMAMELVRQLEQDYQLRLYPREIFEQPSIDALAKYLLKEIDAGLAAPEKPGENPALAGSAAPENMFAPFAAAQGITALPAPATRNPAMVFLLSAPRSGSTLLRVMLAGHPDLFSPPELHLLPYAAMGQWMAELEQTYLYEGLQRAFMELKGFNADESRVYVNRLIHSDAAIQEVYLELQALAGDRLLVDKSPSYALNLECLERAEALFEGAKYILLVRHPYSMIDSSVRIRLEKLFNVKDIDPYAFSEQIWARMNGNLLEFMRLVGASRCKLIRYEDLVADPIKIARELCAFLGIPFSEELLHPYEGSRMTDGLHAISLGVGDPNFLAHQEIDPRLGEAWKSIELPVRLAARTIQIASELGYELPRENSHPRPPAGEAGNQVLPQSKLVNSSRGSSLSSALVPIQPRGSKPPFFLVHPGSGIVFTYYELGQYLDGDQPLFGLQDPSLSGEREPHAHIEDYAAEYLEAVRSIQPCGPYMLGGWSFGGHVAFEMAKQLTASGQSLGMVVAFDTEAPRSGRKLTFSQWLNHTRGVAGEYLAFIHDSIPYIRDAIYLLAAKRQAVVGEGGERLSIWEYAQWIWSNAWYQRLERRASMARVVSQDSRLLHIRLPTVRRVLYVLSKHLRVVSRYRPQAYPGKLILFRADEQVQRQYYSDHTLGWEGLASGGVEVHSVPGTHATLFQPPNVQIVAEKLRSLIAQVGVEPGN